MEVSQLIGKGVHPGTVRGYVRLLTVLGEARALQPGDIVVTPMLSSTWLPFLRKASAIVVDGGGVTSPIATALREFSLPAIVATNIATRVFKNGDLVEVDGERGVVRKVG